MTGDRPHDAFTRWAAIGRTGELRLEAVELLLLEVPFRTPVATSRGVHQRRPLVMVHLAGRRGRRAVQGWGECAALADTTYDAEDAAGAFVRLERELLPALVRHTAGTAGLLPSPADLPGVLPVTSDAPLAFAALEMAVADAWLRAENRSLAAALGVDGREVPVGAVLGQVATESALVDAVGALVEQGYGRVKLKIGPGWDVVPVRRLARDFPGLALQIDANAAYRDPSDAVWPQLDRFGLRCIEQPFAADDLADHVALAQRLVTPICLDEGAGSPAAVEHALAVGACSVVCVKPARLGGMGAALQLVDGCAGRGVPLWIGGMFESGFGRSANIAVAALPGFAWAGDLSAPVTYLAADVCAGAVFRRRSDGVLVAVAGSAAAGSAPAGIGPPPVAERVAGALRRRAVVPVGPA